jgi:trans-aconitate 3-methyltransferase
LVLATFPLASLLSLSLIRSQCYSEFRFSNHPKLTHDIIEYASVPTRNVGAYFERPGRSILEDHLQKVRFPVEPAWDGSSGLRVYYVGDHYSTTGPNPDIRLTPGGKDEVHETIFRKEMSFEDLDNYLRTWSALHTFHTKHPEDRDHVDGDIVTRLINRLKEGMAEDLKSVPGKFDVEWPIALIMIKKAL